MLRQSLSLDVCEAVLWSLSAYVGGCTFRVLPGCCISQVPGRASIPGSWTSVFLPTPFSCPWKTKSWRTTIEWLLPQELIEVPTPASLAEAWAVWGTYTVHSPAPSLLPDHPPHTHTPTQWPLNPVDPEMLLPQEKLCGWQHLKSLPRLLQPSLSPHPTSRLTALPC